MKTDRELARLGSLDRPDRAWEIWNDNYNRRDGRRVRDDDTPWVAWHPTHGDFNLPSVEAAIRVATSFH